MRRKRKNRRPTRRRSVVGRLSALAVFALLLGAVAAAWLFPGPRRTPGSLVLPSPASHGPVAKALVQQQQLRWEAPFVAFAWLTRARFEAGEHWLAPRLSPVELSWWLRRAGGRPTRRLVVPEGFNRFQLAKRVERLHVCSGEAFLEASARPSWLSEKGLEAGSAEGYLLPATYAVHVNTPATQVVERLLEGGLARLREFSQRHASQLSALQTEFGWDAHDIVTLASMIERESANAAEQPVIASVFFNRLRDPSFLPRRRLQSDPTAAYGCRLRPELGSCAGFHRKVRPEMLRDAANLYNTYSHAGLPPGPIANPSATALSAVVAPAQTPYFFFVANPERRGTHIFSRNLEEHRSAIRRGR